MLDDSVKKMIIGSLLKKECNEAQISQQYIVNQTGKSKQYVSSVFTGVGSINPTFVNEVLMMVSQHEFIFSESYHENIEEMLNDYLVEYSYMTESETFQKIEDSLNNQMYFSFACPEYLVFNCVQCFRDNDYHKKKIYN